MQAPCSATEMQLLRYGQKLAPQAQLDRSFFHMQEELLMTY